MFSFLFKILIGVLIVATVIIITPNPVRNQFPEWIKKYENYKDPQSNHVLDIDQLEIMVEDPLKCYKNADCILILCGKLPNCHSISLNREYFDKYQSNLPSKYQCPSASELEADDCGQESLLDTFAACDQNQCVKKRLFPTPTPSSPSIIEKAISNQK